MSTILFQSPKKVFEMVFYLGFAEVSLIALISSLKNSSLKDDCLGIPLSGKIFYRWRLDVDRHIFVTNDPFEMPSTANESYESNSFISGVPGHCDFRKKFTPPGRDT